MDIDIMAESLNPVEKIMPPIYKNTHPKEEEEC